MKRLFAGLLGLAVFVSLTIFAATFQPAQLFLDINTVSNPVDSNPMPVCEMGTVMYLSGQDVDGHDTLYRTDGTTTGTFRLHSFETSTGYQNIECLWSSSTLALFRYANLAGGSELWRSDGTAAGTFRLIAQTANDPAVYFMGVVGGQPVFWGNDGVHGMELMVTDGTVAGTHMVVEMTPGADGGYTSTGSENVLNGKLYFAHHEQMWETNLTQAGTRQVSNYTVDPMNEGWIDSFWRFNGGLLFRHTAADGTSSLELFDGASVSTLLSIAPTSPPDRTLGTISVIGTHAVFTVWRYQTGVTELWTTDGTGPGTHQIGGPAGDLDPGFVFGIGGSRLIFNGKTAANGAELWATDGTDAGTVLLRDFTPGPTDSHFVVNETNASHLSYLRVTTAAGSPIWVTDGTVGGTRPVSDLDTGMAANATNLRDGGFLGTDLYFWNTDAISLGQLADYDLWRYDTIAHTLTKRGTLRTTSLSPLTTFADRALLFAAWTRDQGFEPWISDGTIAGTKALANLAPESTNGGSDPGPFLKFGDIALFGATIDGASGLWRTDGTLGDTQRIGDAAPIGSVYLPPGPRREIRLGDKLLYGGQLAYDQWELFTTDGTPGGTHVVLDLSSTSLPYTGLWTSNPASCGAGFVALDGKAYYGASNARVGTLYRTDGTAGGTESLGRFPTSARLFNPASTVCVHAAYKGAVYFSAEDPDPNSEATFLWRNDGTVDGNTRFKNAAGRDLAVADMVEIDGLLWFTASDGVQNGLWRSDGTPANTTLQLAATAFPDQQIGQIRLVGRTIYFKSCTGSIVVCRLVRTDGTAAGTFALGVTDNSSWTTLPGDPVTADGKLLFVGRDAQHGSEPWITDGTVAGTRMLADTVAGTDGGEPTYAFQFNGYTYFYATRDDGSYQLQDLWRTDGTPGNTERTNLMPAGSRVLTPGAVVVGQKALLVGYNETIGNELWVVENEAPVAVPDTATTTTGTAADIAAAGNDSDPDGMVDGSSMRVVAAPGHGTASVSGGVLRYTSAAGFTGTDTFTYAIADKQRRESAPATVTVTVNAAASSSSGGGSSSSGGTASSSSGGTAGGGKKGGGGSFDAWLLAALALLAMRVVGARLRSANTPKISAASPPPARATTPGRRSTSRRSATPGRVCLRAP